VSTAGSYLGLPTVASNVSTAGSYIGLPTVASNVSTAGSYLGLPVVASNVSTVGSVLTQTATQGQYLVKTGTTTYGWSTIVASGGGTTNGLIIQRGLTTAIPAGGYVRVIFPTSTYTSVTVTASYYFTGGGISSASNINALPQQGVGTITYVDIYGQQGFTVQWLAVGV
jgi:hypothetical protein